MSTDSPSGNGRLSVSEERLKYLLAEFKLELVKDLAEYATTAALSALELRVKTLELWQAAILGTTRNREDITRRNIGWGGVIAVLLGIIVTLTVALIFHHG